MRSYHSTNYTTTVWYQLKENFSIWILWERVAQLAINDKNISSNQLSLYIKLKWFLKKHYFQKQVFVLNNFLFTYSHKNQLKIVVNNYVKILQSLLLSISPRHVLRQFFLSDVESQKISSNFFSDASFIRKFIMPIWINIFVDYQNMFKFRSYRFFSKVQV